MRSWVLLIPLLSFLTAGAAHPGPAPACDSCEAWNQNQAPFKLHGNSYYVGVRGLSAVLITSGEGHVLIDGGLPESAPKIAASIEALGFHVRDIKLILNSHVHFDHAGGIAELQRASGARVAASKLSIAALESGKSGPDDPQFGELLSYPGVAGVTEVKDGETLRVGPIAVTAHFTPGHTPGGTSFTWRSCEGERCLDLVFADSLTPVAARGFKFTKSPRYPHAIKDFEKSFATVESLPCDLLVTTHPDASDLWPRLEKRALVDRGACKKYVAWARERLRQRVAGEQ